MPSHISTGSVTIGGCTKYSYTKNIIALYQVGQILFSKIAANRGILEKIAVKKILCNDGLILYKDTFNRIWTEDELVVEVDANNLKVQSVKIRNESIRQIFLNGGCV